MMFSGYKKHVDDLAVFGGEPLFAESLHVGRPNIGDKADILSLVGEALDRRWLTNNGPLVQRLERSVADFLGVRHCILVCNATVGLEVAARALGLQGEVIVPSFTFVASAHALQMQGISPVFCDVNRQTHNLDPGAVEALITPRTTGIMGVHVWGRPCAVEELTEIAHRHHLRLMFDAAHAFGCSHNGRMIGNLGDVEVFSFHATKFFNTFEGGAMTTNDDDLAKALRLMINFGFAGYDDVVSLGTNGKMSEVSAAMGLVGLRNLGDIIDQNRRNYQAYVRGLQGLPGLQVIKYNEQEMNNYQYIVIEVDEVEAGIDRDRLMTVLHAENVLARRYFYPGCHRMEPYRSRVSQSETSLPVTEELTKKVISLPNGTAVGKVEVGKICDIIRFAVERSDEIERRLRG